MAAAAVQIVYRYAAVSQRTKTISSARRASLQTPREQCCCCRGRHRMWTTHLSPTAVRVPATNMHLQTLCSSQHGSNSQEAGDEKGTVAWCDIHSTSFPSSVCFCWQAGSLCMLCYSQEDIAKSFPSASAQLVCSTAISWRFTPRPLNPGSPPRLGPCNRSYVRLLIRSV